MSIQLQCPTCGRLLTVPNSSAGSRLVCNGCGANFQVPSEIPSEVMAQPSPDEQDTPYEESTGEALPWPSTPPPPPPDFFSRLKNFDASRWALIGGGFLGVLLVIGIIYLLTRNGSSQPEVVDRQTAQSLRSAPAFDAPLSSPLPQPPPASAPASNPPAALHVSPQPVPPDELTDARIAAAIQRGVDWMLTRFDEESHQLRIDPGNSQHNAMDALCVYALLQAGLGIDDPRLDIRKPLMRGFVTKLDRLKMETHVETYARGLRATALAVHNRPEDQDTLREDVAWLRKTQLNGAYGYGDAPASDNGVWDHSNTQYGQLGVWSGVDAGVEVPLDYWRTVQEHWGSTQNHDGSWGYRGADQGTLTMTCAGLASLFVTHDHLDPPTLAEKVNQPPFPSTLQKALDWCEQGGHVLQVSSNRGYSLYGIERVGLASGLKFIGDVDWYQEHASLLLKAQLQNGSWGDEIETSYALLFLARGRHPIVMNKLRFEGHWANRWRDVANLSHFASTELERPFNWQVVPSDRSWKAWADSPVLYLASHEAPKLSEDEIENLRDFTEAGGLLFTHADGGQAAFNDFAAALAKQLFPRYPLTPLSPNHPIYSILYKLDPPPPLLGVSNGVRLLMVHSPTDLSAGWHPQLAAHQPEKLRAGVNLFLYAAGKRDFHNRLLDSPLRDPAEPTGGTVKLARLVYGDESDGKWNPEPAAWSRFAQWFTLQTNCRLQISNCRATMLENDPPSLAHLTGAESFSLNESEIQALRRYIQGGGVLLIDAAGGSSAFNDSATRLLAALSPDHPARVLALDHPIYINIDHPKLRLFTIDFLQDAPAPVPVGVTLNLGQIIFSPLDLTAGVLGTRVWGISGYEPESARIMVKNLILWSATHGGAQ